MENKSLFTVAVNLPEYIKNLKEKIKNKILYITFGTYEDNYIERYGKYIDVFPNRKYGKVFINFKNKYVIKKFCENIRKYDNKIDVSNINLQLYPDYNTFTSVKIKDKNPKTTNDILYDYIKNLEYIKYCFFIENLYIYFSFKEDAENFLSKEHILDNIILDVELAKFYDEISEKMEINNENVDNKNPEYSMIEDSNIEFFINGKKYDEINNIKNEDTNLENIKNNENNLNEFNILEKKENNDFEKNIINENNVNLEKTIDNFQEMYKEYAKEIKYNIDNLFTGDKKKYGIDMKLELNQIMAEISLFKNNYQDFIKYNNK